MTAVTFVSTRGRCYSPTQCEKIVFQRVAAKWRDLLLPGWHAVVRERFADDIWLRSNNGCTPGTLVRLLETAALAFGR